MTYSFEHYGFCNIEFSGGRSKGYIGGAKFTKINWNVLTTVYTTAQERVRANYLLCCFERHKNGDAGVTSVLLPGVIQNQSAESFSVRFWPKLDAN